MKVVVLGAGVIGVTTAYRLAKDGHEVVVVERNGGAVEEASHGNAGIVAPGHAFAWASPAAPLTLLESLWKDDTALRFRFSLDPAMWLWSLRFLANCTAARNRANTLVKLG
ncbi:MAG: FAD-dependent oxidoreductase, partial [Proteobacteria bacterium]|nr:FAD-dependent oxidoreductase [Pseudomonadota bacterium]